MNKINEASNFIRKKGINPCSICKYNNLIWIEKCAYCTNEWAKLTFMDEKKPKLSAKSRKLVNSTPKKNNYARDTTKNPCKYCTNFKFWYGPCKKCKYRPYKPSFD